MREKHIVELLDRVGFENLGTDELNTAELHAAGCADCTRALDASRVAADLLRSRSAIETPMPSAFFQQRVLAALREKQLARKPIEAFRRWWQAAYPMVCTMLLVVGSLGALTFFAPGQSAQTTSPESLYTADAVIMNQRPSRNMTTEQTLEVIYNERGGGGKR